MRYCKNLTLTVLALWAGIAAARAQVSVGGTVTDAATGEALVGVSVAVGGTTRGVYTDLDGHYTVSAPAGATLVFGYLGYKTVSEKVGGRKVLDVAMEADINTLDEVVMLGYSSVRKTELSSSVKTVRSETLKDVTTPDLAQMLQGKVAGVEVYNSSGAPGAGATIRIRGTGSITAGSDPLYVVDGVAGGTFNPNDIESVTVLKDAGATALYGASGAGGVIVITTRHASPGENATIQVRAQAGVKQMLTGRFRMMDGTETYDFMQSYLSEAVMRSIPEENRDLNYDWLKEGSRLGVTQDYYVSASGSNGPLTYLASFDNFNEKGILKHSDYNRLTGRLNLGTEIAKNVTFGANLVYSRDRGESGGVLGLGQHPWDNPYDETTGGYLLVTGGKRSDNGKKWWGHDKTNPLYSQSVNSNGSQGSSLMADLNLGWRISEHLSLNSTFRFGETSYHAEDIISPRARDGSFPDGRVYKSTSWGSDFTTTNLLRYSVALARKHNLSALLGWEWSKGFSEWSDESGTGIVMDLTSLSTLSPYSIGGNRTDAESYSFFGQAMYSYDERYILSGTLRADASSVFAPDSRTGWFPSVSAAWIVTGEDFMKSQDIISYLKIRGSYGTTGNAAIGPYKYLGAYSFNSIQYLGVTGGMPSTLPNDRLHWETAVMRNLGIDLSFKNFLTINIDLYSNLNKDLLLDVPQPLSSGFESRTENSGIIRNRGIEVELTTSNITTRNFRWTTGFNIGHNKNVVVSLPGYDPDDPTASDIIPGSAIGTQIYRVGEPLFTWYMPKWLGVDPETGDPLWEQLVKDEDGNVVERKPTTYVQGERDSQIVGCAQPKLSGGLSNNFYYKGFELSVTCQFQYGNDIFNWTRTTIDSDGSYSDFHFMSLDNGLGWSRWEQPGDIATHPKAKVGGNHNANTNSSRYLEDGSYFRIKNVTLAYNLPSPLLKHLRLKGARIFLTSDNVLTLSRFSGMDPEVGISGTMSSTFLPGTYSSNYPKARLYSAGVDIRF